MSALTSARNTVSQGASQFRRQVAMRAGAAVFQGGMVAVVDGYGLACAPTNTKPGTGDGYLVMGIAESTVDNTDGSDGDLSVECLSGIFKLDTGTSSDQVVQADVGHACYITNDHTVTPDSSSHSAAGTVWRIDDDGQVWVALGQVI